MDGATWALASGLLRIAGALFLAGSNVYLYRFSRRRYLLVWTWAWLALALAQLIQQSALVGAGGPPWVRWMGPAFWTAALGILTVTSALLLMIGSRMMLGRPLGRTWPALGAALGAWIAVSASLGLPTEAVMLPVLVFTVVAYARIGVTFISSPVLPTGDGTRVVGIGFLLWAAQNVLYLVPEGPLITPTRLLLAAFVEVLVGAGLMLVFFERGQSEVLDEKARLQALMADELLSHERMESLAGELVAEAERERRVRAEQLRQGVAEPLSRAIELVARSEPQHPHLGELRRIHHEAANLADDLLPAIIDADGTAAAIAWSCAAMGKRDGIDVTATGSFTDAGLDAETRDALFFSVAELLANVAQHSCARAATVELAGDRQTVTVVVSDGGVGFNPSQAALAPEAHGLFGISRRLGMLGGALSIDSKPSHGTRVTITMRRGYTRRR